MKDPLLFLILVAIFFVAAFRTIKDSQNSFTATVVDDTENTDTEDRSLPIVI